MAGPGTGPRTAVRFASVQLTSAIGWFRLDKIMFGLVSGSLRHGTGGGRRTPVFTPFCE